MSKIKIKNATTKKKRTQREVAKDFYSIKQWKKLKAAHPDKFLLLHIGDFYLMYEEDAKLGSKVLGITLTKRYVIQPGPYMAGFPCHAFYVFVPKLIRSGEQVMVCEIGDTETKILTVF